MRGSLQKRGKDSWTIILSMGRDPSTGKRCQQWVTVKGTKKDAQRRLVELLHQLDTGGYVRPSKLTLGEFLRVWLRDYAATNVRPRTLEDYRSIVERHLVPSLGSVPLTELRPKALQDYYADRLARGRLDGRGQSLSANSVLHHHRLLFEALEHAVKWGLVARNVARAVDPPRIRKREMRMLDAAGLNTLLEAAKATPYHALFLLAAHTGMRRSELLGLRWGDVDLDMPTLSVARVMHQLKDGRIVFDEPKTAKGRRLVPLTPTSALALRSHREKREAEVALLGVPLSDDGQVFCHLDGSPLLPDSVTHAFVKLARVLGLGTVRFHDLRHTHASLMLRQGVHPKIVSERLGHATVSITLDTYSHVTPGLQEAAARRFEEVLETQPAPLAAKVGG